MFQQSINNDLLKLKGIIHIVINEYKKLKLFKESWVPKNWCFWTVVLQKTFESPLDCKEVQPVHPKGDQSWMFIGRTDAETPLLWPPHEKSWLIGKDPDAGRDWGQEEKGTTEDEMAGWHHWLDGHESEWAPGVGDGRGGLACCDSWVHKELDTTERLIWSDLIYRSLASLGRYIPKYFILFIAMVNAIVSLISLFIFFKSPYIQLPEYF